MPTAGHMPLASSSPIKVSRAQLSSAMQPSQVTQIVRSEYLTEFPTVHSAMFTKPLDTQHAVPSKSGHYSFDMKTWLVCLFSRSFSLLNTQICF